ncbi:MAG: MFS transporter [Betaproteobacteria bacterium]|nr:MFS transporter [Betaproteobacteria bacterium]
MTQPPRASHARLAAFYFAYFAYVGAFTPYFSLYLAARGFGPAEIAAVLAAPQLARIVAPTLWGALADRWAATYRGARRAVVAFGVAAALFGFAALRATSGFGEVLAVMLVMSMLSAGALPLVEAITLSSLESRPGGYGPIRLWGSVGFIAAVMATGPWLDARGAGALLSVVIGLMAATFAASLALPRSPAAPAPAPRDARLREVLLRPGVAALLAACFCMTVAHGALYAFYSIYLASVGYSKTLIGMLWTLGVLAEIVVFMRWPQILSRFSLRAVLLASFLLAGVRFTAIGWGVGSLAVLVLAQLLHAATFGTYHAAAVAAIHKLFGASLQGRGQALYASLAGGLGGAVGMLLSGWSWQALGPALTFSLSALFGLAGAALVAWKVRL